MASTLHSTLHTPSEELAACTRGRRGAARTPRALEWDAPHRLLTCSVECRVWSFSTCEEAWHVASTHTPHSTLQVKSWLRAREGGEDQGEGGGEWRWRGRAAPTPHLWCSVWSVEFFTAAPTAAGATRLAEETEAGGARAAEPGRPRWKCSSRRGRAPAAQPAGRGPRCGRRHAPRCTASSVVVVRGCCRRPTQGAPRMA